MDKTKELLTQNEAADYLRVSTVTLWRLRRDGSLPAKRAASKILYRREDLDRYLDRYAVA